MYVLMYVCVHVTSRTPIGAVRLAQGQTAGLLVHKQNSVMFFAEQTCVMWLFSAHMRASDFALMRLFTTRQCWRALESAI